MILTVRPYYVMAQRRDLLTGKYECAADADPILSVASVVRAPRGVSMGGGARANAHGGTLDARARDGPITRSRAGSESVSGRSSKKSHPVGKSGRRDMPVETRSRAALAMRDIQAIEESVPRVRDALLTSAKKVAASARSRPTSPVPVSESTTAPVVVGPTETPRRSVARVASDASADVSASDRSTSPILPPTPAIHPSRPRELSLDVPASPRAREDGTRSTPGTPPSHRKTRLIPAPDLAAETSGASDPDAHTPAHVTEMHISQFAESLRALRDLGISGIRDLDGSFREASEEQESEQMRVLLEERSRAREMVRKLERDKEMQAEQLRMMEERMIDHELTEEELAAMEEALARARGDAADAARAKSALEAELARQIEMGEAWSRRLREAEEGEVKLTASAEKAHRALAKKEAEVKDLSSRLGDLERELDALRRRNTNEPVDANANADTNADPKTPAERKLRRVVAVDETPSPKKTVDDDGDEPVRANRRVSSRRPSYAVAAAVAVAAVCFSAIAASVSARGGAAGALAAVHAAATATVRYASPTMVVRVPEAEEYPTAARAAPPIGEEAGEEAEEDTTQPEGVVEEDTTQPEGVVEADTTQPEGVVEEDTTQPEGVVEEDTTQPEGVVEEDTTQPEGVVEEDTTQPEGVVEEDTTQPEGVVEEDAKPEETPETAAVEENAKLEETPQPEASASPVDSTTRDETTEPEPPRRTRPAVVDPALEAAKAAARAAEEKAAAERAEKEAAAKARAEADARAAAEAEKEAAAKAKAEAAAKAAAATPEPASRRPPVISPADADSRASENRGWDASVTKGWDAWRRLGGSDRRARVKTAARRAESAVDVAKQSWAMHVEAAERYADLLDRIETHSGEAAERQRLTFASHEADAERAGSARRWDSMRAKATQAVRALETELRAVGE